MNNKITIIRHSMVQTPDAPLWKMNVYDFILAEAPKYIDIDRYRW